MNEAAVYDLISYFFMNEVSRGRTTTSTEIMIIIKIMMIIIIIIIIIIGRKTLYLRKMESHPHHRLVPLLLMVQIVMLELFIR